MSQSIEQKKAKILQFDPGASEALPIHLFSKLSNKSTKLINNTDPENYMKGRSQAYRYELKDPVFVSSIEVQTEGYLNYKQLEFR